LDLSKSSQEERAIDAHEWNELIATLPGYHILQTWQWGQIKSAYGWDPMPQVWRDKTGKVSAAALVLSRTIRPGGFSMPLRMLYVPRGPLVNWSDQELSNQVLNDLEKLTEEQGAIFIKIDPEVVLKKGPWEAVGGKGTEEGEETVVNLKRRGWQFSSDQVQFRNTLTLDLSDREEDLLARMKQKTRYNLRLAERKGVRVREGNPGDYAMLYRMYAETSIRDGFVIRPESYYCKVWKYFEEEGLSKTFIAEIDGQNIAGLILFHFNKKAWYLYGMSSQHHREMMPNYLLQWKAICYARTIGCQEYDLWGAPDVFDEKDPMWGVFRFKEGLGGMILQTAGAWDYAPRPLLYKAYTNLLPKFLEFLRRRRKNQTLLEN
jgi:peptidoglycan pentaglycine glycine transferase (the first glycine)